MIFVKNTPNYTGIAIYGDFKDFEGLYDSLHNIVGLEEDFTSHRSSRLRVLGICYDIRHAMMGDREIEFVENSMDSEKMKNMAVITPEKNVYLKIHALWPEVLFVTMVLNDFVRLYGRRKAKSKYDFMLDKQTIWDENIAQVRLFQTAITKCIKETVSDASFSRMMNLMNKDYTWFEGYVTQYLDMLNCRYIDMDKEKKLKSTLDEEWVKRVLREMVCEGDVYDESVVRNRIDKIRVFKEDILICCKNGEEFEQEIQCEIVCDNE